MLPLVLDLLMGRIPEEEFLARAGLDKAGVPGYAMRLLETALGAKDPDMVESGVFLMYRFGYAPGIAPVLNALSQEDWHRRHEDIVFALGKLKDPSSVPFLSAAAEARHPYLQDDEAFALGTKAIYALRNIGTPEALEALARLSRSSNEVLRESALGRIKDLAKKSESESIRKRAAELLS